MHTGAQYHEFMLASPRDRAVRDRFQKMALNLLPAGADVLDFGVGTGIDAKAYAASGHPTFVYEPSPAMREYLARYCRDEIARKTIVVVASPLACKAQAVTANFAVLNHFADHAALFEELSPGPPGRLYPGQHAQPLLPQRRALRLAAAPVERVAAEPPHAQAPRVEPLEHGTCGGTAADDRLPVPAAGRSRLRRRTGPPQHFPDGPDRPAATQRTFSLALRSTNVSVPTMREARRAVLSGIPATMKAVVYKLAERPRQSLPDWSELPFPVRLSQESGIPAVVAALHIRELAIVHSQEIGSHTLFLGRIVSDGNLAEGTQLHHTAGFHQAWRRRQGMPFAEI